MKKKFLIILIPLLIASLLFVVVYRHYNKEDKTTTLTVSEKRWVQKNKDKTYDFEVVNDYPLYGMNGEGVVENHHPVGTANLRVQQIFGKSQGVDCIQVQQGCAKNSRHSVCQIGSGYSARTGQFGDETGARCL